jgi:two-component system NtrC family sensor kinase
VGDEPYLAAVAFAPGLGWRASVARPAREVVAPLRRLFQATAAVLGLSLLAVVALSWTGARAVAGPIAQLSQGARRFAEGDLAYRLDVRRQDELGQLARAFNQMGQSLEEASQKLVSFNESLQREVEARTSELKLAQQQLLRSQRLAAVGDLSAGFAHEMNNPLAAVVGLTELLLWDAPPASRAREMLEDVHAQAVRISDIVKDVQALAETERGVMVPLDVPALLSRALDERRAELERAGVPVRLNLEPGLSPVLGDGASLTQVFAHLLSNARDALAGRPDPRITVSARSTGGQAVTVEVADTGRGIPPAHLDRIFNPFFTTKHNWTGKGLALSICHRIVDNHGGRISIESEEGVGTTVRVVLPAAPPEPHLR